MYDFTYIVDALTHILWLQQCHLSLLSATSARFRGGGGGGGGFSPPPPPPRGAGQVVLTPPPPLPSGHGNVTPDEILINTLNHNEIAAANTEIGEEPFYC